MLSQRISRLARSDRRGVAAVEFALVSVPFFLTALFVFEIARDLFHQEALDAGLHLAVRQVQTGNAQNVTNGAAFITSYLCPNVNGLLNCSSLYVKVQNIAMSSNTSLANTTDYYNSTTGALPMTGGALDLSSFGSTKFCNSGPVEYILVTAIYTEPSILNNLLPNVLSVSSGGSYVHATMSQVATITENYPVASAAKGAAAGC